MEEQRGHAIAAGRDQRRHFDIVGSLPLELVVELAQYLDGADIIRSRRVRTTVAPLSMFKVIGLFFFFFLTKPRSPNNGK